jgi:FkbM family methyltransferase
MTHVYDRAYAQKEFQEHGETWLQERFKNQFKTVFDVGSNIGEWTNMARSYQTYADIHMFEVIPDTYRRMLTNIDLDDKMIPNSFGLSDSAGSIPMRYKSSYDALSTSVLDLQLDDSDIRTGLTMTGDQYVESRQIEQIDYLKIDTEGAEGKVFKGFENTLKEGKVKVIQFEYSFICVLTKWMLIDSYKFLKPLGFTLGKLRPDNIEFHEYSLTDEDFIGPDYIAVHDSVKSNFGL